MSDPIPVLTVSTVQTCRGNDHGPSQHLIEADSLDQVLAWFVSQMGSGSLPQLEKYDPVAMSVAVDFVRLTIRGRL